MLFSEASQIAFSVKLALGFSYNWRERHVTLPAALAKPAGEVEN
jgi:hypothetical protein